MQTYLPYPSFQKSAECLDYKRLGNQRVEANQILNVLRNTPKKKSGWHNHPTVLMWKGYEQALEEYKNTMIIEWIKRGYKNTMVINKVEDFIAPPWLGKESFHASHRSNLLRKNFEYYSKYNWTEPPTLSYDWPKNEPATLRNTTNNITMDRLQEIIART